MKIVELVEKLNNKYDFSLAEDFDNVGLLIGDYNDDVNKILTTLDIDFEICREAVENDCNVIISHHPLFAFDALKTITYDEYNGKLVKYIIENNLNLIAMHTNVDNMNGEVSKWIAEEIGLDVANLFYEVDDKKIGVICNVNYKYSTLLELLKEKYGNIKYIGEENIMVSSIAIVGGSGSFLLDNFINSDVDVFITGDLKYHDFHEMYKLEKCVIDIGHYAENIFMKKILNNINVDYVTSKRKSIIKN